MAFQRTLFVLTVKYISSSDFTIVKLEARLLKIHQQEQRSETAGKVYDVVLTILPFLDVRPV